MAILSLRDAGTDLSCLGGRWICENEHIPLSKQKAIKHCNQSAGHLCSDSRITKQAFDYNLTSHAASYKKEYEGQRNEYLFP